MTTIRITRHNSGNPVLVGHIGSDSTITEREIDSLVNTDDGHMHDLLDYAGDDSTIPEGYEWTGDECYEIVIGAGDRVEGGQGEDRDTGVIDSVDGDQATVRWDSLVVTTQPVTMLKLI